ncbi:MAG: HD domain-containing protein [Desulfovibrio sp.]|jgi:(p)ppGpp synthase/HD superfamily hydrolase|nr:bifunctional (p)ppGpp synthetase/guanosine-3',5'-bis(diphosphate) 3'-pyrophosphohydrolase [Mailhella sp.]
MDSLMEAMEFLAVRCEGDADKNGVPYWTHPVAVFLRTREMVEELRLDGSACIAALLHDAVEDGKATFEEVETRFGPKVCGEVRLLTHRKGVPYPEYIDGIIASGCREAMAVKLADLLHNTDPDRLGRLPEDVRVRLLDKYGPARAKMEKALASAKA